MGVFGEGCCWLVLLLLLFVLVGCGDGGDGGDDGGGFARGGMRPSRPAWVEGWGRCGSLVRTLVRRWRRW